MTSLKCGILKRNDAHQLICKTETHRLRERTYGRESQGVGDGRGHSAVFNMENQQGPAGQHRELCSILCNHLMVTRGKDGGRDSQGVWDGHGHTAVFNMENQQGPAGQHRELCSVSCRSLDGRGVWGRMDTCPCLAESLRCPPETITSLLISYSPVQSVYCCLKKARTRIGCISIQNSFKLCFYLNLFLTV